MGMNRGPHILAEFKGTYRAPHPAGIRDQQITPSFHVKVKMKREWLEQPGLNAFFQAYYKPFLQKLYPDFLDTHFFDLIEATELDGTEIESPKALSHAGLLGYIERRGLKINALLYGTTNELRNQVILYEEDQKGQQILQGKEELLKGTALSTAAELQGLDDVMVLVNAPVEVPSGNVQGVVTKVEETKQPAKSGK
jgi:hypothetical protein